MLTCELEDLLQRQVLVLGYVDCLYLVVLHTTFLSGQDIYQEIDGGVVYRR